MRLFDYSRATRLMDERGIDFVLASSRPNVGYLADYWHNVWDDYYLLWDPRVSHKTLAGIPKEPTQGAFLVATAAELVAVERSNSWIEDRRFWGPGFYIQSWTEPDPDPGDPMDLAAQAILEKGLGAGCIAVEMRYLGVSYFEQLRARLPAARFVNAEPWLWAMRKVKSAEEIHRMREACVRTVLTWQNVMSRLHVGMSEIDLQAEFKTEFPRQGLSYDGAYCLFGPAGVKLRQGPSGPTSNHLHEGQFVRTDIQGTYEGYYCDMSRVFGFGQVRREMEEAHALVRRVLEQLHSLLKPGLSCGEVRQRELELYAGSGYGAVVPFTGHGLGRMVHEPPYLFPRDPTLLEAGMMVTLEPTVCYSRGGDIFICLEDQVLVTENGCENLTGAATLDLYLSKPEPDLIEQPGHARIPD